MTGASRMNQRSKHDHILKSKLISNGYLVRHDGLHLQSMPMEIYVLNWVIDRLGKSP